MAVTNNLSWNDLRFRVRNNCLEMDTELVTTLSYMISKGTRTDLWPPSKSGFQSSHLTELAMWCICILSKLLSIKRRWVGMKTQLHTLWLEPSPHAFYSSVFLWLKKWGFKVPSNQRCTTLPPLLLTTEIVFILELAMRYTCVEVSIHRKEVDNGFHFSKLIFVTYFVIGESSSCFSTHLALIRKLVLT